VLLIDVGNTRLKAAFADELDGRWSVPRESEEPTSVVTRLLDCAPRRPQRVVVSCVGESVYTMLLREQCLLRWGIQLQRLVATANHDGVTNGYADPQQLGIDRWAAVVEAWHWIRGAAVVVDCGTAITVDTVDGEGRHLGGLIFPGLQLAEASFYRRTNNPQRLGEAERNLYANNTADAVANGVRWSVIGGINGILDQVLRQLPSATPVLLTGGDAAELLPDLQAEVQQVEYLVFKGMARLAR
jgi:type III pantothenate kinase